MKTCLKLVLAGAAVVFASAATAVPVVLDASTQCSEGNATNGISVGDVTGNAGGANDCWGTYDGNDDALAGFEIDGVVFDFLGKLDVDGYVQEGELVIDAGFGGSTSGTWAFDSSGLDTFLIVLKAASKPGFAVWLFDGAAADSTSGTWDVAWGKGLSHISVYGTVSPVPLPGSLLLLGTGLLGFGVFKRKKAV